MKGIFIVLTFVFCGSALAGEPYQPQCLEQAKAAVADGLKINASLVSLHTAALIGDGVDRSSRPSLFGSQTKMASTSLTWNMTIVPCSWAEASEQLATSRTFRIGAVLRFTGRR